ncbi:MAG: metal ABC transporter ATP-binding protein [Lachnospiraceae bacterium]|nr:metal ABC transporter ATP-binding protein [Lachnospiraceae bacterium]
MDKENKQLICKNITIAYERVNIFEDVSMTVCEGDYISIVGENGTGKSTMIKGILGLVPLKKGSIEYGDEISKKNIGYLPQQTAMKKDFPASVKEVILSGSLSTSKFSVFYSAEAKKKVKKVMERLSITNLANKTFGDLSGGQKQRVLLARALMATDKILFLDEPIAGLDPIVTAEFYEIIKDLNIKNNLTIIMVSHDLENAMKYSNKILHMDENKYFFGTREEYLESKLARGFLAN